MITEKNIDCHTHHESDIDFNIYYNYDIGKNNIEITGLYLVHSQVDLIDVIGEEVKFDLESELLELEEP